ncbi:MAG TPA: GxxExxY protein [Candidatus Magasanikbacteria bacterium]|nr:GxxExxY protein [Candidatus Magasanikbacteria bacterium]
MIIKKEWELTQKIIGIAIEIHKTLGPGFKEYIYHQAMINDLIENKFDIESEFEYDVYYKNKLIGTFRVDLLVNNKIIIELKAVSGELPKIFQTQTVSYLKASKLEVGLLINFGNPKLEIKRIVNYREYDRYEKK